MDSFEWSQKALSGLVWLGSIVFGIILAYALMGCSTVQKAPDCPICDKCPPAIVQVDNYCEGAADRLEDALSRSEDSRKLCEEGFARSMRKGW